VIPINNEKSCLSPLKLDIQSCFENQGDYEDNLGAERIVSESSKE
jgi:hypothetical protein